MLLKKILLFLLLLIGLSILISKESNLKRPSEPVSEGCLFCHSQVKDPDPSHPASAIGCASCHLGNAYSLNKNRAHTTMVINPGDLRVVERTCGKTGCHAEVVPRVKNSLMSTNRGILKTIQYHWLGLREASTEVRGLLGVSVGENLAVDHYRKMCGGCHLWKPRGDRPGEVGLRGGGCSDCHVLDRQQDSVGSKGRFEHPRMTIRIPSRNCVKCHNRSARIGLSYYGRYESARYGTPYERERLSSRRLSGYRFFLHLQGDIHFSKAGMECIDCHTAVGIMGDGRPYAHLKEQVDITCEACHFPAFGKVEGEHSVARKAAFLNRKVPSPGRNIRVAFTKKGTPIYNLQKRGGNVLFYRKIDGRGIEMEIGPRDKPYHDLPGHDRLTCQACHSRWIPQCYGCHLSYKRSESQRDWITGKSTPGRWRETRSYIRFSRPALGVDRESRIYPVSPCEVFMNPFDERGVFQDKQAFKVITLSAFDPHTTSHASRSCRECHGNPKVLGLGEGILWGSENKRHFRPTYDSAASGLPVSFPLDGFTSPQGMTHITAERSKARPFNGEELGRIMAVNVCTGCHDRYDDKIYRDFEESRKRFERAGDIPCKK